VLDSFSQRHVPYFDTPYCDVKKPLAFFVTPIQSGYKNEEGADTGRGWGSGILDEVIIGLGAHVWLCHRCQSSLSLIALWRDAGGGVH
jgi:hypothetical protein